MKKSLKYIQDHKDECFIFDAASKMIDEGFDEDTIVHHVIIYLNNLIRVKEQIIKAGKVA